MLDKALRDRSKALVDGDIMGTIRAVENARLANELMWGSRAQLARRDALLKLAAEPPPPSPAYTPPYTVRPCANCSTSTALTKQLHSAHAFAAAAALTIA
ncbi:MAG: hypothetical protein BCS36_06510 [Desulfovibrio sp. MES5]|uniref:hypothetical protein n=1 Tax=Desulfovibrio sp. MES5 TaxID=1899016 RepID=UPI000B9D04FB|nr:hypothetical protein [Desulfovibrio sp. MES5]OXS29031.1 MAG: hypothetical protein BCS36_06510 [Desulfovibrio sp. MES5]